MPLYFQTKCTYHHGIYNTTVPLRTVCSLESNRINGVLFTILNGILYVLGITYCIVWIRRAALFCRGKWNSGTIFLEQMAAKLSVQDYLKVLFMLRTFLLVVTSKIKSGAQPKLARIIGQFGQCPFFSTPVHDTN